MKIPRYSDDLGRHSTYELDRVGFGSLFDQIWHPEELIHLPKLGYAACSALLKMPRDPHWRFCYFMLYIEAPGLTQLIQPDKDFVDTASICYLVLRALDNVEDDTTIALEAKVPILMNFHRHIYDSQWHFPCGKKKLYKYLMDKFHHVSYAFLGLERSRQELIEDTTKRMGAGMAKFIGTEIETIDDYDEYSHYTAGLVMSFFVKLAHDCLGEDLASDALSNSAALLIQKTDVIYDYLEDINEKPKPRMLWPRQIWSKYVDKLMDLKDETNSVKAVQCLNDMVTNALSHAEDCLTFVSAFRDPAIVHSLSAGHALAFGMLCLCYNNILVLRGHWIMRPGLVVNIGLETRTLSDLYRAFYDFSCLLKSKIDDSDPNAEKTKEIVEAIIKTCIDSGTLDQRKPFAVIQRKPPPYMKTLIFANIMILLAIVLAYLLATKCMF